MLDRTTVPLRCCLVLLSVLALACGGGSGPGGGAPQEEPQPTPVVNTECPSGEFDHTYDAIQSVIFDGQGCTTEACHGAGGAGGLDLRAGHSYANLSEVPSQASGQMRLVPGEPTESFLYQKLRAATVPGSVTIGGSPMPVGRAPIPEEHLEALKIWIEQGAPETGSVGDSVLGDSEYVEDLLGTCLPPATPITIEPLAAPAADEGVQFRFAPYTLPARTEVEICYAQYYDFSDVIPEDAQDRERGVFFINGQHLRQDPHSHHLVIDHSGLGAESVNDPSFGAWTCAGGADEGQVCEPLDAAACGDRNLCRSAVSNSVACIGFGPPGAAANVAGGGIAGAQTAQQYLPPREGVYREIPIRGILFVNSHAFNLTGDDHSLNGRLNLFFARDRRWPVHGIVDVHSLYIAAGQPPFTTRNYCSTHTLPRGAELLSLSSHTHKRGRNFTVDLADGRRIYESFSYSDPIEQNFEPPMLFDAADAAARTLTFCADFNNGLLDDGEPDLRLVTRLSTMPDRTSCRPVACTAGQVGAACSGAEDDASCDSTPGAGDGVCDACPITAGLTTENEMFVLSGTYIVR